MIKLYFKYFSIQLRSLLEYKKSFIFSLTGQFFSSIFSILSIYFLFDKFGNIEWYTFSNVLICFIVSFVGFSVAECFFRGFDQFEKMGRTLAAIVCLVIFFVLNPELLQIDKVFTICMMILGTIVIYASLFIMKGGITFFTTQSLEIMNIFTDGGKDLAQYPLSIYNKYVKAFFTYILPLAFVNYFPLLYVIGRTSNKLYMLAPIVSVLFIIPCYIVWKIGVRKYKSTGS